MFTEAAATGPWTDFNIGPVAFCFHSYRNTHLLLSLWELLNIFNVLLKNKLKAAKRKRGSRAASRTFEQVRSGWGLSKLRVLVSRSGPSSCAQRPEHEHTPSPHTAGQRGLKMTSRLHAV